MIENQSFLVLSINICQSVIFLRATGEGLSALGDRLAGRHPLPPSSQWYRALLGKTGLRQAWGEHLFTRRKRAKACAQSNHPAMHYQSSPMSVPWGGVCGRVRCPAVLRAWPSRAVPVVCGSAWPPRGRRSPPPCPGSPHQKGSRPVGPRSNGSCSCAMRR